MELITIQELGTLTPSKSNIEVVSKQLSETVLNGNADPLEFAIRCKFVIECLSAAMDMVKETALNNIDKETTLLGAKVEVVESGVKYDYSANETWNEINMRLEPLLSSKKSLEDKIKMATKIGNSIIDEETGEIIASPVTKLSTTVLKITLGK